MHFLLRNKVLDKCWQAGISIELFRSRTESNTIDKFDVVQNCENILKVISTSNLHISWIVIAQLVLGTARIYKIQVESMYKHAWILFINRPSICFWPVRRKRLLSSVSESTTQSKRRRKDSDVTLTEFEPTRRFTISDFLSLHEEEPEENLQAGNSFQDRHITNNSLISLKETIPVRSLEISDARDFGQASYNEFQELFSICDIGERVPTHINPEVRSNPRSRKSNSTLPDDVMQAKRPRFWENNQSLEDSNEIFPDDDLPLAESTNFDVHLMAQKPNPKQVSQKSVKSCKIHKKPFRDLVTELKMPTNSDNLDCRAFVRHRNLINNIPKKLYNPLMRKTIYTVPFMTEKSSNSLGIVRPIMAECLMNQYQRNLKTTKKSQKRKEKTLDTMTLLDEFFNKSSTELENSPYDVSRSKPQQTASIEELEASLETCQSNDAPSRRTSFAASARTNSTSVSERSCILSPTQLSDECVSQTSAAESQFTIKTSDRFADELNMFDSIIQNNIQLEWGTTGLLKKLFHFWNANCVSIDMKMICRGASRKCAALAFSTLMVLQSNKYQYVVLEKVTGSNTIKNIMQSNALEALFQEYLEN